MKNYNNKAAGTFVLRIILGLIVMMQGGGKIFNLGLEVCYQNWFAPYEQTFLPVWLLKTTLYYTTYVEFIGGILLVIGLFRNISLLFLASVLIIITFGHGLSEPIWNLQHMFFRMMPLVTLLLLPKEWDQWNFDNFLSKKPCNKVN